MNILIFNRVVDSNPIIHNTWVNRWNQKFQIVDEVDKKVTIVFPDLECAFRTDFYDEKDILNNVNYEPYCSNRQLVNGIYL